MEKSKFSVLHTFSRKLNPQKTKKEENKQLHRRKHCKMEDKENLSERKRTNPNFSGNRNYSSASVYYFTKMSYMLADLNIPRELRESMLQIMLRKLLLEKNMSMPSCCSPPRESEHCLSSPPFYFLPVFLTNKTNTMERKKKNRNEAHKTFSSRRKKEAPNSPREGGFPMTKFSATMARCQCKNHKSNTNN